MRILSSLALGLMLTACSVGSSKSTGSNPGLDFSGASLKGMNFSGRDLSGANFTNADLSRAQLSGTDLHGASLSGALLTGVRSGSITGNPKALPRGWTLVNGYLIGPGADLRHAVLSYAKLDGLNLDEVDFTGEIGRAHV